MARTTEIIQNEITTDFINSQAVIDAYQPVTGSSFNDNFTPVSIERQFFYSISKAIGELENLLDLHKREITEIIEEILPHRAKWYRDKALKFMIDHTLIPDTDRYDTQAMTEDEITAAQIIKYAAAVEINGSLIVKIATGGSTDLYPVLNEQQIQFETYMNEIRDAGVRITVVNQPGDNFICTLRVFYDAILNPENVQIAIKDAIKEYITGLPFNGEYSNMALVDNVQKVDGVKVVSFIGAASLSSISDKIIPVAGYFTYNENNITLEMTAYEV
ncbi:MAG: hypothetical protein LBT04_02005 [Prevotellaceae bacterium]|jgi:hypothetical protein|nr:hypothetical protein [Prevotellaceae bacterium]